MKKSFFLSGNVELGGTLFEECTLHTMQGMNEVQRHSTSPMTPLLRTAGRRIPWSPQERSSELPQMLSMVQRYGAHSVFMRMNQDLVLDEGTAEGVVTYAARYMMKK